MILRIKGVYTRLMEKHFDTANLPYREVVALFVPLLINQAFISVMGMFNTAMISSSGADAVSAVSMVDSLNMFLTNVFMAVSTGGTVVIAQYFGAHDAPMVKKAGTQAISAVFFISLALSLVIALFRQPVLFALFGAAEQKVLSNAAVYLLGSCLSYPLIAMVEVVCGVLRGVSESKSSMAISVVMNITYLILNVLFITIFGMGVAGMVTAMIISRAVGAAHSLIYIRKVNYSVQFKFRGMFSIDISILRKILFIGVPFAMEQLFFNGGKLLTQTFIVGMGTNAMTTNAICNCLMMLVQIISNALSVTAVTVVGQCMGRREVANARKYIRGILGASCAAQIICGALMLALFPLIIRLFSPPQDIISNIFLIMLISCVAMPLAWSHSFVIPGALRAAGDSRFTSIVALSTMWIIRVVLGYILGVVLKMQILGVFLAMEIEWCARGFIFNRRLKGDKWSRHRLI